MTLESGAPRLVRYRKVDSRAGQVWMPVEKGWRSGADCWLVLHDLFHHQDTDDGSLEHELATVGAEYYVNGEGESGEGPSVTLAAAGLIGVAYAEEGRGPEFFKLKAAPQSRVDDGVRAVLRTGFESAVAELFDLTGSCSCEAAWKRVRADFSRSKAALGWMVHGYAAARERFPDQEAARLGWDKGLERLNRMTNDARWGSVLVARRVGYSVKFRMIMVQRITQGATA